MIDIRLTSNNYKRHHVDLIAADDKALAEKNVNFLALSYTCSSLFGSDPTREAHLNLFTRMSYLYNAIPISDIAYTYYDLFRDEDLLERYNSHTSYIKYLDYTTLVDVKNHNIKNTDLLAPFFRETEPKAPLSRLFYSRIAKGLIEQKPAYLYSTYDRKHSPSDVTEVVDRTYISHYTIADPAFSGYVLLVDVLPSINLGFIDLGTNPLTVWKKARDKIKYIGLKPPQDGKRYKKVDTIEVNRLVGLDAVLNGTSKLPMISFFTKSPVALNHYMNREIAKLVHSRPELKGMTNRIYAGNVGTSDGNYDFARTVLRKDRSDVTVTYSDNSYVAHCDDFSKLKSDFKKFSVIDKDLLAAFENYTNRPRECIIHTGFISSYPVYIFPPGTPKEKYKEYIRFSAEDHFKRENLEKVKQEGGTLTFLSNEDSMTYTRVVFGKFHPTCVTTTDVFKKEFLNFYVKFGVFGAFEKMLVPKVHNRKLRFSGRHYHSKYSTILTEAELNYEAKHIFRRKIYWKNLFALTKDAGDDDHHFKNDIELFVDAFIERATLYDFKGLLSLLHSMDLYIKKKVIPTAKAGIHLASARKLGKLYVILASIFHMDDADTFWRSEFNEGILLTNFTDCDINIQLMVLEPDK